MNVVFAATGPAVARVAGVHEKLPAREVQYVINRDDCVVGALHDDTEVIQIVHDEREGAVALGSDARSTGRADELLRLLDRPRESVGDLVLLGWNEESGLVGRTGRSSHRLYQVEPPEGGVLVASNLYLLKALLGSDRQVDRSYEDCLLGFGILPDGRTTIEGVRSLPAEAIVAIDADSVHRPEPGGTMTVPSDRAGVVSELYERFMAALEVQAAEAGHHAVLLGGFDSALVVAGLKRLGHTVETYTFQFPDPRFDQRNVDVVADALDITTHWVPITPEVIETGMRNFGEVVGLPSGQPHYQLHTIHTSGVIAQQGHDHVFTGDGCDAVFLGYPTVSRRAALTRRMAHLPTPLVHTGIKVLGAAAVERRFGHVARVGRTSLERTLLPEPARGHLPTRYLDAVSLSRLRLGPPPPQAEPLEELRIRLAAPHADLDPIRLAFHGNALTQQSRTKVEAAVASTGLAQHTPYTHPFVKDFVAALPADLLRSPGSAAGGHGKEILVEMIHRFDLLPRAIVEQPKQSPSDSPIDSWYAGPLRATLFELLRDLPFDWNRAYVEEILAPKLVERWYRERVSISHHAFQAIGILWSYAACVAPDVTPR
jgi:asparagine synthetase B (glutamine-hydrolysing)